MPGSKPLILTAAVLASIGATFMLGSAPASALDLDDLREELPAIRRAIPVSPDSLMRGMPTDIRRGVPVPSALREELDELPLPSRRVLVAPITPRSVLVIPVEIDD